MRRNHYFLDVENGRNVLEVCPPNTGPPVAACSPVQSCPPRTICYAISGFCCGIMTEPISLVQSLPIPVIQQHLQTPIPVVQQNSLQTVQQQQIVIMCPSECIRNLT